MEQGVVKTTVLKEKLRGDSGGKDFRISLTPVGQAYLGMLHLEFKGRDF